MRWWLLWSWPCFATAQVVQPQFLTELPPALNEVSGSIMVDGDLWVLLDSFNPAALYQVDPQNGAVQRTVTLTNATNVDWEELTTDGTYVYVGDIGNNFGARTDLRIWRFPYAVLQDPLATSTTAEAIAFSYADQTDHTPALDDNNWDAEALVALDDSLFLFTKNWLDGRTNLYALPAQPGTQVAQRRASMDTQGLVTGASRAPAGGSILLIGYTEAVEPFLWQLYGFEGHAFFSGMAVRSTLDMPALQVESTLHAAPGIAWITQERNGTQPAGVWSLQLPMGVEEPGARGLALFPNPARDGVWWPGARPMGTVHVRSTDGRVMLRTHMTADGRIELPGLPAGAYLLERVEGGGLLRQRLLIQR